MVAVVAAGMLLAWSSPAQGDENDARLQALERRLAEQEKQIADLKLQLGQIEEPLERAELERIAKEIEAEADAMKVGDWAENFDLFGDLRLRFRVTKMGRGHMSGGDKRLQRGEFRLRIGAKKTWWDEQMEVGFRLATGPGGAGGTTSTNQPFAAYASDKPIWIDTAYAKYSPSEIKGLTIVGGKMDNPLTAIKTEMLWDSDVTPEGIAAIYAFQGIEQFQPFIAAGALQLTATGAGQVHAYQGGIIAPIADGIKISAAATWYDFCHAETTLPATGGNTGVPFAVTAGEFDVFDARGQVEWMAAELPMSAFVDYARNCEDQVGDIDEAYSAGIKVGTDKKKGDWFVRYRYAKIDANVFPSAIGDGDFMGTDRKGHEIGAGYMISDFLKFETELICNEPLSNQAPGSGRERELQLLFDLIWSW